MSFSYNHAQGGEKKIYVLSGKRREKKLLKKKDEEKERDIQSWYKEPRWIENRKEIHAKIRGILLGYGNLGND